jgi:hypothetical protein
MIIIVLTAILELIALIYLWRKTDSTLLRICVTALIVLSYVPDPIPYVDEIILNIIVFSNREFAAKLVVVLNIVNLILTGLILMP